MRMRLGKVCRSRVGPVTVATTPEGECLRRRRAEGIAVATSRRANDRDGGRAGGNPKGAGGLRG